MHVCMYCDIIIDFQEIKGASPNYFCMLNVIVMLRGGGGGGGRLRNVKITLILSITELLYISTAAASEQ